MGAPRIMPKIVKYLIEHTGEAVHVDDLASAVTTTRLRAQQAMYRLIQSPFGENMETLIGGNVWRYRPKRWQEPDFEILAADEPESEPTPMPSPKPNQHLYEELGKTNAGEVIVRDDDGTVYKLTEL